MKTEVTYQYTVLESSMEKIARIMAHRHGVQVEIHGQGAYVDLERMVIVLPSSIEGMELLKKHMHGLLDHETAHIIYTDIDVIKEIKGDKDNPKPDSRIRHHCWNGVEDVWIEREHSSQFIGVKQNLDATNVALFEKCDRDWVDGRMDMLGKILYAMERCWRGEREVTDFAADPQVGALLACMQPEVDAGRLVQNSMEALAVGDAILKRIEEVAEKKPKKADMHISGEKSPAKDTEKNRRDASEGRSNQPGDGKDGPKGGGEDAADHQEPASQDSGEGGSGDRKAGGSVEQEYAKDQARTEWRQKLTKDGKNSDAVSPEKAHKQAKEFQKQRQSADGFQQPIDLEAFLNGGPMGDEDGDPMESGDGPDWATEDPDFKPRTDCIETWDHQTHFRDWGRSTDPKHYRIYRDTTDEDEIHFDSKQRIEYGKKYQKIKDSVRGYIGSMASMLELAMAAQTESRWVGGHRRGKKFDKRKLTSWLMGSDDDRLYRQREDGEAIDTAVILLWDCSGSMGSSKNKDTKAHLARIAATAFHEALSRTRIAHEVLGFDTGGGHSKNVPHDVPNDAIYSRTFELNNHYVFVPFGSHDGRAICHISGRAANRDGEALLWAAKRIAMRKESRKIIIVGSDGHPQGARYHRTEENYLREVVGKVMEAGIEVYALGIMDDSVKRFYPEWTVLKSAQDLPRAVMTQLVKSLTTRRGTRNGNRISAA